MYMPTTFTLVTFLRVGIVDGSKKYPVASLKQFLVGVDPSTITATDHFHVQYTKGLSTMCHCVKNNEKKMRRFGIQICQQCGRYLKAVVKTQKARGILQLGTNLPPTTSRNTHYVVKKLDNIKGMPWDQTLARPCPWKPRPGFVDSRMVESKEDIVAIQKEIKDSGEDKGELLLARYYIHTCHDSM